MGEVIRYLTWGTLTIISNTFLFVPLHPTYYCSYIMFQDKTVLFLKGWSYAEDTERWGPWGRMLLGVKLAMQVFPFFFFCLWEGCAAFLGEPRPCFPPAQSSLVWFPGSTFRRNDCSHFLTSSLTNGDGTFTHPESSHWEILLPVLWDLGRISSAQKVVCYSEEVICLRKNYSIYLRTVLSIRKGKIGLEQVVCY